MQSINPACRLPIIDGGRVSGAARCGVRARCAFTIAESLIASAVLAASVIGIAGTLTASYQQASAMEQNTEAVSLARQLIEEISACPFEDPEGAVALGPDAGETAGNLTSFDNIDDFDGYTDTSTSDSTPTATAADGAADVYTRTASVEYRATPGGTEAASGPFALVTVEVQSPRGQVVRISQLFCNVTRSE